MDYTNKLVSKSQVFANNLVTYIHSTSNGMFFVSLCFDGGSELLCIDGSLFRSTSFDEASKFALSVMHGEVAKFNAARDAHLEEATFDTQVRWIYNPESQPTISELHERVRDGNATLTQDSKGNPYIIDKSGTYSVAPVHFESDLPEKFDVREKEHRADTSFFWGVGDMFRRGSFDI